MTRVRSPGSAFTQPEKDAIDQRFRRTATPTLSDSGLELAPAVLRERWYHLAAAASEARQRGTLVALESIGELSFDKLLAVLRGYDMMDGTYTPAMADGGDPDGPAQQALQADKDFIEYLTDRDPKEVNLVLLATYIGIPLKLESYLRLVTSTLPDSAADDFTTAANYQNSNGVTPLLIAAKSGDRDMVELLLRSGSKPDRADQVPTKSQPSGGVTPLMYACQLGHAEVVRTLVDYGANTEVVHPQTGWTAYHSACFYNMPDCVDSLLLAGCDTTRGDAGQHWETDWRTNGAEAEGSRHPTDRHPHSINGAEPMTGRQLAERDGNRAVIARMDQLYVAHPFVGVVVIIQGLVQAAQHNGKRAAVISWKQDRGRFELELLAPSSRRMFVREANFKVQIAPAGMAVTLSGLPGDLNHDLGRHNGRVGKLMQRHDGRLSAEGVVVTAGTSRVLKQMQASQIRLSTTRVAPVVAPRRDALIWVTYTRPDPPPGPTAPAYDKLVQPGPDGPTLTDEAAAIWLEGMLKESPRDPNQRLDLMDLREYFCSIPDLGADHELVHSRPGFCTVAKAGASADKSSTSDQVKTAAAVKKWGSAEFLVDPDSTPLLMCARHGRLHSAKVLLHHGADADQSDTCGQTPLMLAARMGHPQLCALLIKCGAEPNMVSGMTGLTAFLETCVHNQPDCLEVLARHGCDVSATTGGPGPDHDWNGPDADRYPLPKSGMVLATESGHTAVIARLKQLAQEQLQNGFEKERLKGLAAVRVLTPPELLETIEAACSNGDCAIVRQLLRDGMHPDGALPWYEDDATAEDDRRLAGEATPLTELAKKGFADAVTTLLDARASVNLPNSNGATALMLAAMEGHVDMVQLLLIRGADPEVVHPSTGWTAFLAACAQNQPDSFEALCRAGCDWRARSHPAEGETVGKNGLEIIMGLGQDHFDRKTASSKEQTLRRCTEVCQQAASQLGDSQPKAGGFVLPNNWGNKDNSAWTTLPSGRRERSSGKAHMRPDGKPFVRVIAKAAGPAVAVGGTHDVITDALLTSSWSEPFRSGRALRGVAEPSEDASAFAQKGLTTQVRVNQAAEARAKLEGAGNPKDRSIGSASGRISISPMGVDETQLVSASKLGDLSRMGELLDSGVSPNASAPALDPYTAEAITTALCEAVAAGKTPAVELLLARGADPNRPGSLPCLMAAAMYGHTSLLTLLLQHGADVEQVRSRGLQLQPPVESPCCSCELTGADVEHSGTSRHRAQPSWRPAARTSRTASRCSSR